MAKYVDNNITFNNVSEIGKAITSAPFGKLNNYTFNETETDITAIGKKVFNAVDIYWNGADLSSAASSFANAADTAPVSIITTTGELTKEFYSPMFAKAA